MAAALEEGDAFEIRRALNTVARSPGMTAVAEETGLGREISTDTEYGLWGDPRVKPEDDDRFGVRRSAPLGGYELQDIDACAATRRNGAPASVPFTFAQRPASGSRASGRRRSGPRRRRRCRRTICRTR